MTSTSSTFLPCACIYPFNAPVQIEKYNDIDLQFQGSREAMLMDQILAAFQEESVEKFSGALAEFDRYIRLDAWKTKVSISFTCIIVDASLVGGRPRPLVGKPQTISY